MREIRDQIAERIWRAEYKLAIGRDRTNQWADVPDREANEYLRVADAVLQLPALAALTRS